MNLLKKYIQQKLEKKIMNIKTRLNFEYLSQYNVYIY